MKRGGEGQIDPPPPEKTTLKKPSLIRVKGCASTYNDEILNSFNPELQIKDTESAIKNKVIELLIQLRVFKFVTKLILVFKKIEIKDKTRYDNFYSSSNAETIINESDIFNVFQPIYTTTIENKIIFIKRFRMDY